jgi:hypothetical protein
MTEARQRLIRNLTRLNGGNPPTKKYNLQQMMELLLDQPDNSTFVTVEGEFENRMVGDALVTNGFSVTVKGKTLIISW